MSDLNTATLTGRLAQTPAVYDTENGKITRFTLASTEHYRSGEEIKSRVTYNNVAIYDKFKAEDAAQFKKGQSVLVSGAVETHSYESEGSTRYTTEIAVRPGKAFLRLLDVKPKATQAEEKPDLATVAGQRQQQQQARSHQQ